MAKDDDWLSRKEASTFLRNIGCPISVRQLEKMASNNNSGNGPSYRRARWKLVRYHRDDLRKWADAEMKMVYWVEPPKKAVAPVPVETPK